MDRIIQAINTLSTFTMKDANGNRYAPMTDERAIQILDGLSANEWAVITMAVQAMRSETMPANNWATIQNTIQHLAK